MKRWVPAAILTVALLISGPAVAFADVVDTSRDGTTDPKMLIFMVLGVLALIAVSALGPLARMSERRADLERERVAAARSQGSEPK